MGLGLGISGGALPQLYREAQLCLLAARPVGYTEGQQWRNHGTTGSSCDAWPVSVTVGDYLAPGDSYNIGGDDLPGPGFVRAAANGDDGLFSERMFEIAGNPITPADDTKAFTCTIAFTPLHLNPAGMRFAWKYQCTSLPPSPPGLVIENIDNHPLFGPGNYLPAAVYNGRTSPADPTCCFDPPPLPDIPTCTGSFDPEDLGQFRAGLGPDFIERTRQVVTLCYDPIIDKDVTGWRNGTLLSAAQPIDAAGPWLDASNLRIGAGQICHAVLWHPRALTDTEIQFLHQRLR